MPGILSFIKENLDKDWNLMTSFKFLTFIFFIFISIQHNKWEQKLIPPITAIQGMNKLKFVKKIIKVRNIIYKLKNQVTKTRNAPTTRTSPTVDNSFTLYSFTSLLHAQLT